MIHRLTALLLAAGLSLLPTTASASTCGAEWVSPECNDGYALNGYWWYGDWVPGLPTLDSWFSGSPILAVGNAVFYGPWVMEGTAVARGFSLEGYVDGVSALSCADLGQEVWLQRPGEEWEGPFLIVDCSQRNDIYGNIVHREEVVELGYKTAERWGMVQTTTEGYHVLHWRVVGVVVSKLPPDQITTAAIPLKDWWLERLTYVELPDFLIEMEQGWQRPLYKVGNSWRLRGVWQTFSQPIATLAPSPMPTSTVMPTATATILPSPTISATLIPPQVSREEQTVELIYCFPFGAAVLATVIVTLRDLWRKRHEP